MYLASFDLLHCNCLSSPGSCPGPDVVHRPSGLQYEINLVIIIQFVSQTRTGGVVNRFKNDF